MDLSVSAFAILGLAAFLTGVSKTGIPGIAILGVVLVPLVLPAKVSTGYILPFLIFSDIIAVLYWRKAAVWRYILPVLPATFVGIVAGYLLMDRIDDAVYGKVLGTLVVLLIALDWVRRRYNIPVPLDSRVLAWAMGLLTGILTMLANAAGPAMMLYLLAMNITKEELVGTNAWLYAIINISKVPFSINLGLITTASFTVNLMLLPCVLAGGITGVLLMRRITGPAFEKLMRGLAFLGGVKLLF